MTMAAPVTHDTPVELRQVPVDCLGSVWAEVAPWLASVVERARGRWSWETIVKQIVSGDWQLWVVWDGQTIKAAVATELYKEATGLLLARVVFTSGKDAAQWSHLVAEIEAWARDNGAVRLEMMARKGWARHLPDFKMTHVLLEKDL